MIKKNQLKKVIEKAVNYSFKEGKLDEKSVLKLVKLFNKLPLADRLVYLKEYHRGLIRFLADRALMIETAVALDQSQVQKIRDHFSQEKEIWQVDVRSSTSLIGGVRVTIADVVFDQTVKSKILQVGQAIKG